MGLPPRRFFYGLSGGNTMDDVQPHIEDIPLNRIAIDNWPVLVLLKGNSVRN